MKNGGVIHTVRMTPCPPAHDRKDANISLYQSTAFEKAHAKSKESATMQIVKRQGNL
jgi:hypothetical protein